MVKGKKVNGLDVPVEKLRPLAERKINLEKNKGYKRILSSIEQVGLIEPLSVYPENGEYLILDGYLRYLACRSLGAETVPCILCEEKEAYTFNRMVNRLSPHQEMRMLKKSLASIDEPTVARVFGMRTIHHRSTPNLLRDLHPHAAKAFEKDELGRTAARELTFVKPARQAEMLKEMRRVGDFSPAFVRALVLKTPPSQRNPKKQRRRSWSEDAERKRNLVAKLEEAEQQQDFYTRLYRQYSADLVKTMLYVRKMLGNPRVLAHIERRHAGTLKELRGALDE